ncbi:hypothetical protein ACFL56_02750 [Candidatus Margulisiibacteriota bacterium]
MRKLKVYLDTSIINFLFANDAPEFKAITNDFFRNVINKKKIETSISKVVIEEINNNTNQTKKRKLHSIISKYPIKILKPNEVNTKNIELLANKYLKAKIIPANKLADALHIAYAVVFEIDILLSWNFKHLANINKEYAINIVNKNNGFNHSFRMTNPMEVFFDD